jgi:hypothetical protein
MLDGRAHLARDPESLGFGEGAFAFESVSQGFSGHIFRGEVRSSLVRSEEQEPEHEGMVELAPDFLFLLEDRPSPDAAGEEWKGNLEHDRLIGVVQIFRLEDRRHSPSTDLLDQPEPAIDYLA